MVVDKHRCNFVDEKRSRGESAIETHRGRVSHYDCNETDVGFPKIRRFYPYSLDRKSPVRLQNWNSKRSIILSGFPCPKRNSNLRFRGNSKYVDTLSNIGVVSGIILGDGESYCLCFRALSKRRVKFSFREEDCLQTEYHCLHVYRHLLQYFEDENEKVPVIVKLSEFPWNESN